MIHHHGGAWRGIKLEPRLGLLFGSGTYAYLPFDCRLGGLAAHLWVPPSAITGRGTLTVLQNGAAVSAEAELNLTSGQPTLLDLSESGIVLPGVTSINLDDAGQLGMELDPFALDGPDPNGFANLRTTVELIPTDASLAGAEIHTLYASGERALYSSLFEVGHSGAGAPPFSTGVTGYANGYMVFAPTDPVFNTLVSYDENGDGTVSGTTSFYGGAATPLARGGVISHLTFISSDPAGIDGVYAIAMRKNASDALVLTTAMGASRIVSTGGTAHYDRGDQWCVAVTASSGTVLKGHIVWAFTPDGARSVGGGWGATGWGAQQGWGA